MKKLIILSMGLLLLTACGDDLVDLMSSLTQGKKVKNMDFSKIQDAQFTNSTVLFYPDKLGVDDGIKLMKLSKKVDSNRSGLDEAKTELEGFCSEAITAFGNVSGDLSDLAFRCTTYNVASAELEGLSAADLTVRDEKLMELAPVLTSLEGLCKKPEYKRIKKLCLDTALITSEEAQNTPEQQNLIDKIKAALSPEDLALREGFVVELNKILNDSVCDNYTQNEALYNKCMDPSKDGAKLIGLTKNELNKRDHIVADVIEFDKGFANAMAKIEEIVGLGNVFSLKTGSKFRIDENNQLEGMILGFKDQDYRSRNGEIVDLTFGKKGGILEWRMMDKLNTNIEYKIKAQCHVDKDLFFYNGSIVVYTNGEKTGKGLIKFSGKLNK